MFVMAVAFLVHTVEGIRGPPQASLSVLEKEILLKDECRKFGAKKVDDDVCMCPHERPVANPACGWGNGMGAFKLTGSSPNCRCLTEEEQLETLQLPVAASALRFCSALVEEEEFHIHRRSVDVKVRMEKTLEKTSPEMCQHALTGTLNTTEAQEAPWAEEASKISDKGAQEDREYGRMRPVKEEATDPVEKELWERALSQVCQDECEELMDMMKKETAKLAEDVVDSRVPFAEACGVTRGATRGGRDFGMLCPLWLERPHVHLMTLLWCGRRKRPKKQDLGSSSSSPRNPVSSPRNPEPRDSSGNYWVVLAKTKRNSSLSKKQGHVKERK